MKITPEEYTEFREKLLGILAETSAYEELPENVRNDFREKIDKLQTESFEIALEGEFRGGKSTTFDTFCGGRELSPRGQGIKTSACKISAHNIVNPEEKERAVIYWKTDAELLETIWDIVTKSEEKRAEYDEKRTSSTPYVISDEDLQYFKECIEEEWKIYKERPDTYDPDDDGNRLEGLKIASLIIEHLQNPSVSKLRNDTLEVEIDDLGNYVVFPQDWCIRWTADDPSAFEAEESRFVFISQVECYVHSESLQAIGSVLVDRPSLFAGPWDTRVAQDAISRTDATLYLMSGERTIGAQNKKAIGEILRCIQNQDSLFFAINARSSYEHIRKRILPTDLAMINQVIRTRGGNCIQEENVPVFNAFLAYNAQYALNSGGKYSDPINGISAGITECLGLNLRDDHDLEKMNHLVETPAELLHESRFNDLIAAIRKHIIPKKARTLLYDNGVIPVNRELVRLESEFKSREQAIKQKYEEAQKKYNDARQRLSQFQKEIREIVEEELGNSDISDSIAQDYVRNVYIENAGYYAEKLSERLDKILKDGGRQTRLAMAWLKRKILRRGSAKAEQDLKNEITSISQEIFRDMRNTFSGCWLRNLSDENNSALAALRTSRHLIALKINEKWEELIRVTNSDECFNGLELGALPPLGFDFGERFSKTETGRRLKEFLGKAICQGFSARIAGTVAGAAAWIFGIFCSTMMAILTGLGLIAVIIALLTGPSSVEFARRIREWLGNRIRQSLFEKLEPEIRSLFRKKEVFQPLFEEGNAVSEKLISLDKEYYDKELKKQESRFEARAKRALEIAQMRKSEKEEIAAHARRVYTRIGELRAPITRFIDDIKKYIVKTD